MSTVYQRVLCVPTLVLIARAVFLLERGQTHRQTHSHRGNRSPKSCHGVAAWVWQCVRVYVAALFGDMSP